MTKLTINTLLSSVNLHQADCVFQSGCYLDTEITRVRVLQGWRTLERTLTFHREHDHWKLIARPERLLKGSQGPKPYFALILCKEDLERLLFDLTGPGHEDLEVAWYDPEGCAVFEMGDPATMAECFWKWA